MKKFKTDERAALLYMAAISKNESKTQRIYIFLPNKCTIKRALNSDLIVKVDNQDVRFSQFCTNKQIYLNPETDRGEKFLIEQFMRKKLVYFHFFKINFFFDSKGFKAAWKNYDSNAS
ncbi:hypothetical protein [Celerinatantimonas sp. MCCC 1A17872]|uniref:hypothetical protein n=1 Tax=Celerinatantimonas sp. MCCC 1A17872 TaxID=3177514 RepID=UPI0038C9D535